MSLYTAMLFMHLVGVIAVFVGVGVWLFAVAALRRTQQVAPVRALAGLMVAAGNVVVGGVLLLAAGGFYMALTAWGEATWIVVATISFALLAPFGAFLLDPRVRRLAKAAAKTPDGPLPTALAARARDPILGVGLCVYVGVLFGIVFLMANKPTLALSILVMVVAAALGLASALPLFWWAAHSRSSTREPAA